MLTLEEDFEPIKAFVLLEVAVKALVKISVTDELLDSLVLEKVQDVNITCSVDKVYPRPTFQWSVINLTLCKQKVFFLFTKFLTLSLID